MPRLGNLHHRILNFPEMRVKPFLQLRQGNVRGVPVVKLFKRQREFRSEPLEGPLLQTRAAQDMIGRFPYSRQIIDQRSRPIKDDVSDHARSLAARLGAANQMALGPLPWNCSDTHEL